MQHRRVSGTVGAGATSAEHDMSGLVSGWLHAYGHNGHSAQVQVTLDGVAWVAHGSPSTAVALLELPSPVAGVRIVTTGGTGSMSYAIVALDPRERVPAAQWVAIEVLA